METKKMTQAAPQAVREDAENQSRQNLSVTERLGVIGLIDKGMHFKASSSPMIANLFDDLSDQVDATISGSKINRLNPNAALSGFRVLEIDAESGENLGRLDMLYLKKPIPCYYLVYVEVAPEFRRHGLGHRILGHFSDFLAEKSAVGILDNVIPSDDPSYHIYFKNGWEPIGRITGGWSDSEDNYMIYVPEKLRGKDLSEPVRKLVYHLKRKRSSIDMRDNESMVQRTITEFKELYASLTAHFEPEIENARSNPFMRYMFTRYVTKLISFRRRIGELIGYTGGESMEQISLAPEIASLEVHPYTPGELSKESFAVNGDRNLFFSLVRIMKQEPAKYIESLPDFKSPRNRAWTERQEKGEQPVLTVGDLMDLGFDPTRFKEIVIDGEPYIIERIRQRNVAMVEQKRELTERIEPIIGKLAVKGVRIQLNPPLLVVQDRGNAYVIRRKVEGIHWEEAREQLQSVEELKSIDKFMKLDRRIVATIREASRTIIEKQGIDETAFFECLSWLVSWDLESNRPKLYMDFADSYIESLWIV